MAPLEVSLSPQLLLGFWLRHSLCSGSMDAPLGSSAISSEPGQHAGRHGAAADHHLQLAVPCGRHPCTLTDGQFLQMPTLRATV